MSGILAGAIGQFLVPRRQPMGLLTAMLHDIAGSYVDDCFFFLLIGGS
ncbi:MAG: hypothetical protein KDA86_08900 [Planctomycetaceae bacterium]|nr:hypothetical protein [Planctomycetaceae bacterium]